MVARTGETYPVQVTPPIIYAMRGYDGTLGTYVFWYTTELDATGTDYGGPGPVTDIVVSPMFHTY